MVSTYERLIVNRRKQQNRRGLSPQRRNNALQGAPSSITPTKVSTAISTSKSFFDLLKDAEGHGGELHHVINPNDTSSIAFWSSTFHPCSLFICKLPMIDDDDELLMEQNNKFQVMHVLEGKHEKSITSFDWSKRTRFDCNGSNQTNKTNLDHGRIVTCGEDCRVFVWSFDTSSTSSSTWIASQVLLQHRVSLTPISCQWDNSSNGLRFALGIGGNHKAASIEICSFESNSFGWTSRQIGKREIKSSVLCVAWQPSTIPMEDMSCESKSNKTLVACGGCDNHCRIFYVGSNERNDGKKDFGEQIAAFKTDPNGWVTAISWSETGSTLCFVTQHSSIYVVDCSTVSSDSGSFGITSKLKQLPLASKCLNNTLSLLDVQFVDERTLITGGYGSVNIISKLNDKEWGDLQETEITISSTNENDVCCIGIIDTTTSKKVCYTGLDGRFQMKVIQAM